MKYIFLKNWDIMDEIGNSQSIKFDDLHFHPLYMIDLNSRKLTNETKIIIQNRFDIMYNLHQKIRLSIQIILNYFRNYKTRKIITSIKYISIFLPLDIVEKIFFNKKLKIILFETF